MEKNKVYEIGYLLVPTIAEENVAAEVQAIKSLLEKREYEFITEDFPKLRPLAYTMVKAVSGRRLKFDKAYFGWIKFQISPNVVPTIKSELDKNDNILRYMVINTVRENTLMSQRVAFKAPTEGDKAKKPEGEEVKMTQEEMDKTIENLVVE